MLFRTYCDPLLVLLIPPGFLPTLFWAGRVGGCQSLGARSPETLSGKFRRQVDPSTKLRGPQLTDSRTVYALLWGTNQSGRCPKWGKSSPPCHCAPEDSLGAARPKGRASMCVALSPDTPPCRSPFGLLSHLPAPGLCLEGRGPAFAGLYLSLGAWWAGKRGSDVCVLARFLWVAELPRECLAGWALLRGPCVIVGQARMGVQQEETPRMKGEKAPRPSRCPGVAVWFVGCVPGASCGLVRQDGSQCPGCGELACLPPSSILDLVSPREGLSLEGPSVELRTRGNVPLSPDLYISANPELVHNQTSFQTPTPSWILGFLHFQRRHPHSWVQAGCGKACWYWEAFHPLPRS